MGVNSFFYLKREDSRHSKAELRKDFMNCRDISWLSQVMPLIEEFSQEDDLVFEPFCGMGTTVIGAGLLGRRSIGIELEENRFALLKEHVALYADQMKHIPKLICGDSLKEAFPPQVDLVVTNVPYYNGLGHASSEKNFYNIADYNHYLVMIETVLKKCADSLKREGYLVLFCENIRDLNGDMIPQAYDICHLMQKFFHLKEERLVLYDKDSYQEDDRTRTNRAHEYVFIGLKKDEEFPLEEYLDISRKLCGSGECTLIGSLGLYLKFPQILDSFPQDADFFAEGSRENLEKLIVTLQNNGYEVFSWKDKIGTNFHYELLTGRYYLRGSKKTVEREYIVDITYEIEGIAYKDLKVHQELCSGIAVYNQEGFIKILGKCDRPKNKAQLHRLRQMISHCSNF